MSKTVRETEAEAVAFIVTTAIGIRSSVDATDYIQLYAGNTEETMQRCGVLTQQRGGSLHARTGTSVPASR